MCLNINTHNAAETNLLTNQQKPKHATRIGDINNHIAEHHLQTKYQIDWDSATCITYSTVYYQRLTLESWFTNLEQMPLNRSQRRTNDLLTRSSKTNYERTTGKLTI